ncbi:hypothetical protein IT407_04565 [Candidatus Uhrbacteria bacterium]|nr:hypothetical protein [Candidatus Uhrbacteria bacterium]
MPTDIFVRSHEKFLATLKNARFRYQADDDSLLFFIERSGEELPPAWVRSLKVEIVNDMGRNRTALKLDWIGTDESLMTAFCGCPKDYQPLDFSQDFLPISEIILTAGGCMRRLPNGSSRESFMRR